LKVEAGNICVAIFWHEIEPGAGVVAAEGKASMVSRFEVELCYRFILGRQPESEEVVTTAVHAYETLEDLRLAILASDEFRTKAGAAANTATTSLLWPPNSVDVTVSPDYLEKMLLRVERSWEKLGESEPFWSVLTADIYRPDKLEANKANFYESGREGVNLFAAAAARAGRIDFADLPTCLEYGCGVGRLTIWLAKLFHNVIGCDISQPHLDNAKTVLAERDVRNVELVRVPTVDMIDTLPSFDVFFSLIVLQHNPPPVAAHILGKVLQKLKPNGLAYFQIPTYGLNYRFDARAYIENQECLGMEMHVIPQHKLFALFERCGCTVLEVREDQWTGSPTFVSNSFLLRK
jgi:SAM-dependent methyltransferase